MFEAVSSPFLVPYDGRFTAADVPTDPPKDAASKRRLEERLEKAIRNLDDVQRRLFASDQYAVLIVFQAMDAAGKDGTIRAVMRGIDPAGCQVFSFKQPSKEELDHDFLWRTARSLPERGRIGVFNRSYYEEVLVVRVHPQFLDAQRLPETPALDRLWQERYESIRDHEKHLARNGTVILKFWLNVSKDEQKKRFLSRLDEPQKNWKFSSGDVRERGHWDAYQQAYVDALRETSCSWAPWYAIPADDKAFMRCTVAELIVENLERLGLRYPEVGEAERGEFAEMRNLLEDER